MAVDIRVVRGVGTSVGADILDPLISNLTVALERGRNELDATAHTYNAVDLKTVYRDNVAVGNIIEVHDSTQGVPWRGKVISVNHVSTTIEGGTLGAYTSLKVRRLM